MVYAQASQFDRASVTMKMTAATHAVLLHVFCVFVCMCACVCVYLCMCLYFCVYMAFVYVHVYVLVCLCIIFPFSEIYSI